MRNTPNFDPLNATAADEKDMRRGYCDALAGAAPPRITSFAYDHGRQNGASDRAGTSDPEQRALARRYLAQQQARRAAA